MSVQNFFYGSKKLKNYVILKTICECNTGRTKMFIQFTYEAVFKKIKTRPQYIQN